jgi:hypothetical protein
VANTLAPLLWLPPALPQVIAMYWVLLLPAMDGTRTQTTAFSAALSQLSIS